jgi:uncharacterized protein (DUF1778 family)
MFMAQKADHSVNQRCIDIVDTFHHLTLMENTLNDHTKGSINLRVEASTRRLIDEAAIALGKTRTEFMVETARRQALDVLLDQRFMTLSPEGFDAFAAALDKAPERGERLAALMARVPIWEK